MMTLTFDPLWLYLAVALLLSLGGLAIYWFIQQNRYQQGMENLQQDLTERQQALAQAQQSVALLKRNNQPCNFVRKLNPMRNELAKN